jgi:hypothetical protein
MAWRRKKPTTSSTTTSTTFTTSATTTTSTITTTVPATPTGTLPRRGDWMGISAGATASLRVLDACVDLGVKWVRVSHELGWTNTVTNLANTVTAAHARGLKVLQCIQKAGHTYTATDAQTLTDFALQCAGTGIDALELLNEANNTPFFSPNTLPPTLQANLSAYIAPRVRAQYPQLPITTTGMSPVGGNYTPHLWWPAFWDAAPLANAGAGYTAQALHPFVYPEDPCGLIGHPEWNPWWALPIIRDAMTARGVNQPVWFTEVGCPGDPTGQTVIRNIRCDEARQAYVTSQYLKQWQTLGQPGEPIFIATAYDGDSVSVPGPENYLGLIRADGTKKPAWQIVHDHAALPL